MFSDEFNRIYDDPKYQIGNSFGAYVWTLELENRQEI